MGSMIFLLLGEYLLEMCGINKLFFGVKVFDNVNLNVCLYFIYVLMGENGVGKLILLKCFFGIY